MTNLDGHLGGSDEAVDFAIEETRRRLISLGSSPRDRLKEKMLLAALGSIPWVGGFIAAAATVHLDSPDVESDRLRTLWLEGLREKIELLRETLIEIGRRVDGFGERCDERIQSEEFLQIVRKAFRAWDNADTSQKRTYAATLVTNAAGSRVCSDDVVRLFIDWLDRYHEAHFAVISYVFNNPGCTRMEFWASTYGARPRDDSAEADLFKHLIRDLQIDGVVRNEREVTGEGAYLRKSPTRVRQALPKTLGSPFDNSASLELTSLGKQFVHYTMNEAVGKISAPA